MLLVLTFIWCVVFSLWWYLKPRRPSPPLYPGALPIIGHAGRLGNSAQMWQIEQEAYHYCLENGGLIEVQFGPQSLYVVTDLEDCLNIANSCLNKPYLYGFGKGLYNRGLVTANELTWRPHRKLLNPAFRQQILNTFVEEYVQQAKSLVSDLSPNVGKDAFDVLPYLSKSVIGSAYKTMIGVHDNELQEMILNDYAHATDSYFTSLEDRFHSILFHLNVFFKMSNLKKKQDEIIKTLKNITETIIMRRKTERQMSELNQNIYSGSIKEATTGYKTLFDQLLDVGEKQELSDEEVREHLDTIIGAAYDSSAKAMTFSLILIGSYPDVQARILKELQEVLDDQDRDLTRYDLPKLVYLEAVIKEALRLYPPVPRVGRQSDTAVKLKNYTLPARSIFILSLYGMNRDVATWGADANEFNPDRWLNPDTCPENPNAFATFSIGRRNCLGKQFAMMSMKTSLAYVLRRYRVSGDITKVQSRCDLIYKPVVGHHISLQLRT